MRADRCDRSANFCRGLAVVTCAAGLFITVIAMPAEHPEAQLLQTLELFTAGEPRRALFELEPLLEHEPPFRLAHLVHADILRTLAGEPTSATALTGEDGEALAALWAEARQRWQYGFPRRGGHAPDGLIRIPDSIRTLVVVDTGRSRLYRLENRNGAIRVAADYYSSIGRLGAGKKRAWDRQTPIGTYFVVDRLEDLELNERYGPLALPVDYPNSWDRRLGKTGDGIWLHGIERTTYSRPPRDSDGCVVLSNPDLLSLAEYVDVGSTPVIIGRNIDWVVGDNARVAEEITSVIDLWRGAWQHADLDRYLSVYASDFEPAGVSRSSWVEARTRAFAAATVSAVDISDTLIIAYPEEPDLYLARFRLQLTSDGRRFDTMKQLYIRRYDGGELKIVAAGNG